MTGSHRSILYLDYDGVLHHENCLWHPRRGAYLDAPQRYSLFQHAELLEHLLAPYPDVKIVLSTSWVLRYGCSATAKRLPPGLRARVIGATFHSRHMLAEEFRSLPRGLQVTEDAMRRQSRNWLALDDNEEGWPTEHRGKWVHTHMYEGISPPEVQRKLVKKLEEMCR